MTHQDELAILLEEKQTRERAEVKRAIRADLATALPCHRCNRTVVPKLFYRNFANNTHHIGATCPDCGNFIKWVPHTEPKLYFGKYAGHTVREVAKKNPDYLRWLYANGTKQTLMRQIEEVLEIKPS